MSEDIRETVRDFRIRAAEQRADAEQVYAPMVEVVHICQRHSETFEARLQEALLWFDHNGYEIGGVHYAQTEHTFSAVVWGEDSVMKRTVTVWIAIAIAALALNGTFPAGAQDIPVFENGHWLLPEPESVGMGPDPVSAQGGYAPAVEQWRPAATEACGGDVGCANYVLSVIACESGGDPNAVGAYGELGILQVDPAYWGVMGPVEQIYFFLNPPAGAWWVCA